MSFNTALSGLQAATVDLGVTSNNIANVSTSGFKQSRAEFGDLFAVSPFGHSKTAVGSGAQVSSVSQQFGQGNLEFTDANLDLAINGQGFYVTKQNAASSDVSYTRAGQFQIDADGFITNNGGQFLQTFPVDTDGAVTSTNLNTTIPVQLPATTGSPQATTEVEVGLNLNSTTTQTDPTIFNPSASNTYAHSTSSTVFDSLGASHVSTYYFVHDGPTTATNPAVLPATTGNPNNWLVFTYLDGAPTDIAGGPAVNHPNGTGPAVAQNPAVLQFNNDGSFASSTPAAIQNVALPQTNGSDPLTITHDFANNTTTQFSSSFAVSRLNPDGFSTGRLTGLDISETGLIRAMFSNGVSSPMGQIALVDFPNSQGLRGVGNASWKQTTDSGTPVLGVSGTGRFGLIQSGALEASNVDLTSELVNLITAQRNFQANARSIETSNSITDTIIQIR
ncbi:MAG: flagellar hook protein FlgE [Polaribacter sp.]|jgi:flagellar hook protein FlgE